MRSLQGLLNPILIIPFILSACVSGQNSNITSDSETGDQASAVFQDDGAGAGKKLAACETAELRGQGLCQRVLVKEVTAGRETTYEYNDQGVKVAERVFKDGNREVPTVETHYLPHPDYPKEIQYTTITYDNNLDKQGEQQVYIDDTIEDNGVVKRDFHFSDLLDHNNDYREVLTYDYSTPKQVTVKGNKVLGGTTTYSKRITTYRDSARKEPLESTLYTYEQGHTAGGWPGLVNLQCHQESYEYEGEKLMKMESQTHLDDYASNDSELPNCLTEPIEATAVKTYEYDDAGNPITERYERAGTSVTCTKQYDPHGQVVEQECEGGLLPTPQKTQYEYQYLWQALGAEEPAAPNAS